LGAVPVSDMLSAGFVLQAGLLLWLARAILPLMKSFMRDHGLLEPNYTGAAIPTACGMLLWLLLLVEAAMMNAMVSLFRGQPELSELSAFDPVLFLSYILAMSAVAFAGFMDDAVGFKAVKGLMGHWRLWKEEQICSTGLLKALVTGIAALQFVCIQSHGPLWQKALELLLLGLMTNGVNLLDLRPGRALKGFFTITAAALIWQLVTIAIREQSYANEWVSSIVQQAPYLLPVLIGAFVLFKPDLRGELMLGDTGANLLGFGLGSWVVMGSDWLAEALMTALLVLLHGLAWRSSLTKLIAANRLLQWFDLLGRKEWGKT
jgi:UDP-GlcNAc:undecaprenyl-phosphate GlcNAc-1-phosphate transferase